MHTHSEEHLVRLAEHRLFADSVHVDRLDHQVGRRRDRRRAATRGSMSSRSPRRPSPRAFSRLLRMAVDARVRPRPGNGSWRSTLTAGRGDDLSDPAAHLTGADDEDALEPHRRSVAAGSRRFTRLTE